MKYTWHAITKLSRKQSGKNTMDQQKYFRQQGSTNKTQKLQVKHKYAQ